MDRGLTPLRACGRAQHCVTKRAGASDQADVEAERRNKRRNKRRSNRRRASSRWIVLVAPIPNSGLACVNATGTRELDCVRRLRLKTMRIKHLGHCIPA